MTIAIALGVLVILIWNDPGGLGFDPDSYMRLARFRDGYGIFHGGFVARDNAPYGTVVPWTACFDGALGVFYALGRLFAGPSGALYFAARVVSPFFCVTIVPIMSFGLRPFFSLPARAVMSGLAASAPRLVSFSAPGDADHHAMIVWLSVVFAVALIRHLFREPPGYWDAAATGIAAAIALWTSPEEFIVVGTGLSALVLHRCLVDRGPARGARAPDLVLCGALAIALTAAWLVDRPYGGLWVPDVDRLSIVYVSFAWLFSAALVGLNAYLSKCATYWRLRNLAVAALLGEAAFLCWVTIWPDILRGPFARIDPSLYDILIDQSLEMQPLWRPNLGSLLNGLCLILIWVSVAVLVAQSSGLQRRLWIACAVLMAPISFLGIRFVRSTYFVEALGSIPLGLVLASQTRLGLSRMGRRARAVLTGSTLAVYLVADFQLYALTLPRDVRAAGLPICGPRGLSEALGPIEDSDSIVMADLDYSPMVLYLSPRLRTVASRYIGNPQGILDQVTFFGALSDQDARAILDKRGVDYVLVCDTGREPRTNFSFGHRILHDTPAWLRQVGSNSPTPAFRLYRVNRSGG